MGVKPPYPFFKIFNLKFMTFNKNLFDVIVELFKDSYAHKVGEIEGFYFRYSKENSSSCMMLVVHSNDKKREILRCTVHIGTGKIEIYLGENHNSRVDGYLYWCSQVDSDEIFEKFEDINETN
jgi:hypothetical protein